MAEVPESNEAYDVDEWLLQVAALSVEIDEAFDDLKKIGYLGPQNDIPDWRTSEGYGQPYGKPEGWLEGIGGSSKPWELLRWRWEFTRRREDYRRDFEQALSEIDDPFPLMEDISREEFFLLFPRARAVPFDHQAAKKYGLFQFYDPFERDWRFWMEDETFWGSGLFEAECFDPSEVPADGPFISLVFDLSRPITAQFEDARKLIEQRKGDHYLDQFTEEYHEPPATKAHPTKWLTYLRLLDAKADGASLSDMSSKILAGTNSRGDQRTAGNMLKQAEEQMFRF